MEQQEPRMALEYEFHVVDTAQLKATGVRKCSIRHQVLRKNLFG